MDLVDVFLRCIGKHDISQHRISQIIGFRSDNQMTRVTQRKVSPRKMLEFGQLLLEHAAEIQLTEEEQRTIAHAMENISVGHENMYAFDHFSPLLLSQTQCKTMRPIQIYSSSGEKLGTLAEILCGAQQVNAVVLNCTNAPVLATLAQGASKTMLTVDYYYLAESSVMRTVSVLEATWPHMFCPWFHPHSVHLQECRLSAGLWGADIFFLRIASDAPNVPAGIAGRWGMFILQAPQRALLCEISCAPETLLQRKDVICRSLYNDAAQGDYVQYLQYIRTLEHQHRIFRIKPDIGFELIPIDIQIAALEGTSFRSDYEQLVEPVTQIARQRYQESKRKTSRQYHVVSKDAMLRFAQTGILSDHFWGFRPYTCEERLRIFEELLHRMTSSTLFRLRFLREDTVLKPREVIWYEDYGVCILMENSDYRMGEHQELMLRDQLFSEWFSSLFRDHFCDKYTYSDKESIMMMENIIKKLQKENAGGGQMNCLYPNRMNFFNKKNRIEPPCMGDSTPDFAICGFTAAEYSPSCTPPARPAATGSPAPRPHAPCAAGRRTCGSARCRRPSSGAARH